PGIDPVMLAVLVLSAAAAAPAPARVLAVRTGTVPEGTALTVLTAGDPGDVSLRREGDELLLQLGASAPADLPPPNPTAPLEALRLERTAKGVTLHVRVPQSVAYQLKRQGTAVTVLFGGAAAAAPAEQPEPAPNPAPDIAELYRSILPSAPVEGDDAGQQVAAPGDAALPKPEADPGDGLGIGA